MSWWIHDLASQGAWVELLSWVFWVLLSITLHELGHGWAAIREGDRTPIELGRMTMNPIVHMGPQSLLLFALCGIAWGVMPISPHRLRRGRTSRLIVAAAGPAVNLLLAALTIVLLGLWLRLGSAAGPTMHRNLATFLLSGAFLNLFLAGFNLIPAPPLDGARILASLSYRFERLFAHPNAPIIGLGIFILIFFMTPIGSMMAATAQITAAIAADLVGRLVGAPPLGDVLRLP